MDHPRIRGEHFWAWLIWDASWGSSPHTRGAPVYTEECGGAGGIIPAYAGSTQRRTAPSWRPRDHPRIRGEHSWRRSLPGPAPGSSPHTRGAPVGDDNVFNVIGIIPAYAGSTHHPSSRRTTTADHPRIRGEHGDDVQPLGEGAGSSPHTRGARLPGDPRRLRFRIIPAYAGSTRPSSLASAARPDHPRIRGEHDKDAATQSMIMGSSPHTRGARFGSPEGTRTPGIIPAYAGSTCWR